MKKQTKVEVKFNVCLHFVLTHHGPVKNGENGE